jgi:hypothetical protein
MQYRQRLHLGGQGQACLCWYEALRLRLLPFQFVSQSAPERCSIGARLGVSTKTVEAHRARINDKMRSDDLPHLIRMMLVYNEEE